MKTMCTACGRYLTPSFCWPKLFSLHVLRADPLLPPEEWFCRSCLGQIEFLTGSLCAKCGRDLADLEPYYVHPRQESKICHDCLRWMEWEDESSGATVLTYNRSVMKYNEWAQQLINQYKFKGDERFSYVLASLLVHAMSSHSCHEHHPHGMDLVVPIPLSAARMKERGFNQAALVAELFANQSGVPYDDRVLTYDGVSDEKQSKKGREERLRELTDRFRVRQPLVERVQGQRILLIDDIYTTGSTVHTAAHCLKKAGAKKVAAYTVAR